MNQLPDPILIAAVLGSLALAPFLALMVTSYTKIAIVLGLMRMALGTQQVPSNLVLNGIAVIVSVFVMAPVGMEIAAAVQNSSFGSSSSKNTTLRFQDYARVLEAGTQPVKTFLGHHTAERERRLFMKTATQIWPEAQARSLSRDDLLVLIPSFTLSELTKAFQIGFLLYLAFVVVDMIVGNVLLALGMMMISPTVVSVPIKLLLFVALDGWAQLVQGLMLSYRVAGG
jgi:type III secretion protein R